MIRPVIASCITEDEEQRQGVRKQTEFTRTEHVFFHTGVMRDKLVKVESKEEMITMEI